MGISRAAAEKIAKAEVSGRGNHLTDGQYVLVVKQIITNTGHKGTFYIPEFDVVMSSPHPTDGGTPNRPGTDASCAWPIDVGGDRGAAANTNIKGFVLSLFGCTEAEFIERLCDWSGEQGSDAARKARGFVVSCVTYKHRIQKGPNAGKEATYPRFIGESLQNTPEKVAARRAKLDRGEKITAEDLGML